MLHVHILSFLARKRERKREAEWSYQSVVLFVCCRYCLSLLLSTLRCQEETRLKLQCQDLLDVSKKLFTRLGNYTRHVLVVFPIPLYIYCLYTLCTMDLLLCANRFYRQHDCSKQQLSMCLYTIITPTCLSHYREFFPSLAGDLTDLLREIMTEARKLTKAEKCSLFLLESEQQELVAKVFDGLPTEEVRYLISKLSITSLPFHLFFFL